MQLNTIVTSMLRTWLVGRKIRGNPEPADLTEEHESIVLNAARCVKAPDTWEFYGATHINAQISNQELAVALTDTGTVSVFRYPTPSYYDQIKYTTSTRDKQRFGADDNAGAFIGLRFYTSQGKEFIWLRDMEKINQQYMHSLSDTVETVFKDDSLGVEVTLTDAIPENTNALIRHIDIESSQDVEKVDVIAFENYNIVGFKRPSAPTQDWCNERQNISYAEYDRNDDLIYHTSYQGFFYGDRIYTGMAFSDSSTRYQVGFDEHFKSSRPIAKLLIDKQDAFSNAEQGQLNENTTAVGQVNGALSKELDLSNDDASATVIMGAAESKDNLIREINKARRLSPQTVWESKLNWFEQHLDNAPMPATDDTNILNICKRALVCLTSVFHKENGAIVASISTQPPYSLDWIRDGAFFNVALHLIGKSDWVEQRNKWYKELQAKRGQYNSSRLPGTPVGNWVMNYYADGVAGGPIPYEIDATSYGLWTMWYHYEVTNDKEYLREIYPAIKRTADWLTRYRDPKEMLQAPAPEDDNESFTQTSVGAFPVKLALESAWRAAEVLGKNSDKEKYKNTLETHKKGIQEHLWDDEGEYYGKRKGGPVTKGIWPATYIDINSDQMKSHMVAKWDSLQDTFEEPEAKQNPRGLYESKALIGLAKGWKDQPDKLEDVRDGIQWVATHHATDDTNHMGEAWIHGAMNKTVPGDSIVTGMGQPHIWEQILFYLAALEAYPPVDKPLDEMANSRGVIGELLGTTE